MRLIPTIVLAFGLAEALETHRVARAAHHFGLGAHTNKPKPSKAPKPPKPSKAPKPPRPQNSNNNNNNRPNNQGGGNNNDPRCDPTWSQKKCTRARKRFEKREERRRRREQKLANRPGKGK
ncbi:Oidioi.mRNA.OKI2018_I69.chr1.g757.t1.cds [Oikopleura dioica]|uniref:Oidioi.mRNA.OKI2018_I69.chr1.g757.t1.cds n=1 Tax=Oikopleura dioica TaxID=34765 RepID=A0ABN7SKU4_OIKDI|nr:Oidioi.mRNA.OKI2018_I69.chr1.g757.t1.cds [Oikopleura dioica]